MLLKEKWIESPLNYTGGKYKLLSQIVPLFPKKINTFIDIFCGGCNVAINVFAKKIICNDLDKNLIGLLNYFKTIDYENLKSKIDEVIIKYNLSQSDVKGYSFYECNSSKGLGKYNKEKFNKLRQDFNNFQKQDELYYLYLYILIIYAFNNQIRFNSENKFNLPVGKRDFNKRMQSKLKNFLENIEKLDFVNESFENFNIESLSENDFIYADPPYLITCASYNENNGWNENKEKKLLQFLEIVNNKNIKFALSNVLTSNSKENKILLDWLKNHKDFNCYHLDYSYKNSNYQKKNSIEKSDEVLITNYQGGNV